MLNRSASLAMSTSGLKALPGKLDIKRHSPNMIYLSQFMTSGNDIAPCIKIDKQLVVYISSNVNLCIDGLNNVEYCKSGNFRDNFIFANRFKRHICDAKNSRLGHD